MLDSTCDLTYGVSTDEGNWRIVVILDNNNNTNLWVYTVLEYERD